MRAHYVIVIVASLLCTTHGFGNVDSQATRAFRSSIATKVTCSGSTCQKKKKDGFCVDNQWKSDKSEVCCPREHYFTTHDDGCDAGASVTKRLRSACKSKNGKTCCQKGNSPNACPGHKIKEIDPAECPKTSKRESYCSGDNKNGFCADKMWEHRTATGEDAIFSMEDKWCCNKGHLFETAKKACMAGATTYRKIHGECKTENADSTGWVASDYRNDGQFVKRTCCLQANSNFHYC